MGSCSPTSTVPCPPTLKPWSRVLVVPVVEVDVAEPRAVPVLPAGERRPRMGVAGRGSDPTIEGAPRQRNNVLAGAQDVGQVSWSISCAPKE